MKPPIPDPIEGRTFNPRPVAAWLWRRLWWLLPLAFVAGVLYENTRQWFMTWLVTMTP